MVLREIFGLCLPCVGRKKSRGDRSEYNGNIAPPRPIVSSTGRWQVYDATPAPRKGKAKNKMEVYVFGKSEDSPGVIRRRTTRFNGRNGKNQAAEASASAAAAAAAIQVEAVEDADKQLFLVLPTVPIDDSRKSDNVSSSKSFRCCCNDERSCVGTGKSRRRRKSVSRCVDGKYSGRSTCCSHDIEDSRRIGASMSSGWESPSYCCCRCSCIDDAVRNRCNLCDVRSTDICCCAIRTSRYWDSESVYSCSFGRTSSASSSYISYHHGISETRRSVAFRARSSGDNVCRCCHGRFDNTCSNSSGGSYDSSGSSGYYSTVSSSYSSGSPGGIYDSSESSRSSGCWSNGASAGSSSSGTEDYRGSRRGVGFEGNGDRVAHASCWKIEVSCSAAAF